MAENILRATIKLEAPGIEQVAQSASKAIQGIEVSAKSVNKTLQDLARSGVKQIDVSQLKAFSKELEETGKITIPPVKIPVEKPDPVKVSVEKPEEVKVPVETPPPVDVKVNQPDPIKLPPVDTTKAVVSISSLETQLKSLREQFSKADIGSTEFLSLKSQIDEVENSLEKARSSSGVFDLAAQSTLSFKTQIRLATQELTRMEAAGQGLSPQYAELELHVAKLTDRLGDQQQRIRILASDTKALDFGKAAASAAISAFQAYTAVSILTGNKSEELQKKTMQLFAAMQLLQAIEQISNLTRREGVIGTLAGTAAQSLFTVSVGASTVALKAFRVALISTGIGVFLVGLGFVVNKLSNYFDGVNKAAEATKRLQDLRKAATDSVAKEAAEVDSLVAVLQNESETKDRKLGAIKKLNEIAPTYFGHLKDEHGQIKGLNDAYTSYLANLDKVIEAEVRQGQLEDLIKKRIALEDTLAELTSKIDTPEARGDSKFVTGLKNQIAGVNSQIDAIHKKIDEHHTVHVDTDTGGPKGLSDVDKKLIEVTKAAQKHLTVPVDLLISEGDTEKEALAKAQQIQKLFDQNKIKIRLQTTHLNELTQEELDALPKEKVDKLFVNVPDAIQDAINKGMLDIKPGLVPFKADDQAFHTEISSLLDSLKGEQFSIPFEITGPDKRVELFNYLTTVRKAVDDSLKFPHVKVTAEFEADVDFKGKAGEKLKQQILGIAEGIGTTLEEIAQKSVETIGELFGTALAGGNLRNIGKEFFTFIGDAVQSFGKLIIKRLIEVKVAIDAFKKAITFLVSNPILAISAALALIALGAAIKASVNKEIAAREKGGKVYAGTQYLVGEKRPELFVDSFSKTVQVLGAKGPELFTPKSSGVILPDLSKIKTTINNFSTVVGKNGPEFFTPQTSGYIFPSPVSRSTATISKEIIKLMGIAGLRQTGGPVGAGQTFLVGEVGQEFFLPSGINGSQFQKASPTLGRITISNAYSERLITEVSGANLRLILARTDRSQSNNF